MEKEIEAKDLKVGDSFWANNVSYTVKRVEKIYNQIRVIYQSNEITEDLSSYHKIKVNRN